MKIKTASKALVVTLFLATTVIAFSSNAGTRQKPPVATTDISVWYQPVLDFFNFK